MGVAFFPEVPLLRGSGKLELACIYMTDTHYTSCVPYVGVC